MFCTGSYFLAWELPMETIGDLRKTSLTVIILDKWNETNERVVEEKVSDDDLLYWRRQTASLEALSAQHSGNKLFYQGTHGVMTTVLPFKIASLSGTYDSTIYETDLEDGLFDKEFVQYTQTNG
ncbi:MAG: hypothetical protein J3Q66DRAFT_366576 [Benniella sp.]|nr:MAG: hypothetical protein J3Q66DRAFT_366576 [Benniella sp.]